MQKNLVLERSQKQYLIKSASGKDGNAGIDIAFIRTVHRNLLRLYRLYTFVFARGKRALEGADNAVAVVPIQSGTKRQSEQYALFFAMPAALYARSAAESGDKKAYDAYKLTPFSVCAVEDLQKLSQQLANVRCRTQKDFAATMRVLCRAVVTLETPYQMTIDVRQEADLNSVLDNTGDFFLPEETPSPAFSLENNALPAPAGFQSTPKISHPATIGGFAHPAAPARDLMGTIPAPAAPRAGGFAATVPFEGERVTPPQKKAEPPKKAAADAPTFVTDDVQPESPEFDLTNVFSPMASSKPNEFEPPARTPDFKRASAPEKKSAPRQTRVSPFWIGHEAELAPKGRVIEAPGADYTLEESEPTPSAQKAPASFHPMASSTQKEPASFHPMAKPAEAESEGAKKPDAVTLPKDELRAKPRAKDAPPAESRDTLVLPVNVVDAFEDKKEKRPAEASKKSEEDARPSVMAYRFDYFADRTPERQIKSPFRMNTTQKEDTQAVRRIVREDAPAQPEKEKSEEVAPEVREEAVFAAPEIAPDVVSEEKADTVAETTPEIAPNDVQTIESDAPFFVTDIVTDPQPEAEGAQEEKAQAKAEDAPFLVTDIETFTPDTKEEAAQDAVSEQTAEAPADDIAQAAQDGAAEPAIETVGAKEAAEADAVDGTADHTDNIADIIMEETADAAEDETADAGISEEEIVGSAVTAETVRAEDAGTVEEETAEAAETAEAEDVGTVEEETAEAAATADAENVGTVEEETVEAAETAEAEDVDHAEEKADDAPIAVPLYYTRDDRDAALDEELDEIFGELMRDTRHDTPEGELDEFLEELETSQDDSASRAPIPADRLADVLSREDEESGKSAESPAQAPEEPTEASPAPVEPIDIDVDEPQTWQEAVADEAIRHAEQLREGEKPRRTMFVPRIVQTPPAEEEAEEIEATDAPDLLPEDAAAPEPAAEDVLPGELPGEEAESGDLQSSAAEDPARDEDNHENNDNNNIVETADEAPDEDAFAAPRASAPYAYDVEVLVADEVPPQEASRIVGDYERSRGQNVGDLWEQVQKHWDIAEPLRIADENEVRISPEKEAFIREQADAIADELSADEPIDTQHMRDAVNSDEAFAARSRALYDKIRIATPVIPPQDARQSAAPAQEALETSFDDMAETDFDAASDVFDDFDASDASDEAYDDDFEDTSDEAFGDDFDDEIDEPAEEPAFEDDAPVVPAALDALYTPPAALDAPETDEAEDDDETFDADGGGISEESDARDAAEAGENAEVSEEAILKESAGDIAVEETVEHAETADEPALEEEIEEETAESVEANAEEIEAAATDDAQTAVEETEAEPLDAAETETDEDDADGEAEEDEPAALPPQDPFLAAGVPASGPMAALAASIRATQRQLEQEIARIRKRFAAISPEADEDETRAIFGRASIDEALPQNAETAEEEEEEEESRRIVLDTIDDEMNDTAVLDDLFEDAPAWDGADVSSEEDTAEDPQGAAKAEDAVDESAANDAEEAAKNEATDADDAFGELFADDAGDEFVAAAEDPSVKEASNDSDDDEFPSIDDAAFEAVFGQKKTDAAEVPDEAADDVFETESEDALDEEAAETGFVLVNHAEIAENAFAQGSDDAINEEAAENDVTETGFVLVNHTEAAEDAFAQGSDGAVDEEPAETDAAETGFVLVNHTQAAEDAFAQSSDDAVDEEADVPEANEAEFGWNDAVETDEDIFGQDADRAFGLGDAAPKDTEADVVTENDADASDADAPVVAGAVFVPDAEDDTDTLADEDAAQTYGYEQVRTIEPIESTEDDSAPTLEDELAEAADDYAAQEAQIDALLYGDLPAVPDDVFADDAKDDEPSAEEAFETADLYDEGGAFAEEAFEEGADDTEAFDAFDEDEPQPDWADGEDENGEDPWDDRTDEEDFADGEPFERDADFYDGLSDETDAVYGDGFVMLSQDEPSQTEEAPEEPQDDEADAAPAYDEAIYDEERYSDAYIAELDDVLSETAETQEPEESVPQAEASDEDDFDDADASDDPLAEEQARLEREIAEQERLIAESRRNRRMLDELAAQLDRTIAQNTAAAAEAAREQVAREKFERTMRIPAQRAPQQTPPAAFDEPAAQTPPQDYRYGAEDAPVAPQQAHRTQKKAARHRTKRWWR